MSLESEVTMNEQGSVKSEALEREYDARSHTMDGLIGEAGEAAEAAEAYASAEGIEQGVNDHDVTAEVIAEDEFNIDNTMVY